MAAFEDRSWQSRDGLSLHFRDYPGPAGGARAPVICIPGLTRNSRDFETLAPHVAQGRRVICVDLRGRGDSDYAKDPQTYVPLQYAADIQDLLAAEGIERFFAIGTSLGGLVTMLLAAADPARITGAVINDVGPQLEPAGLARIGEYVGQGRSHETWMHAARALAESNAAVYPEWELADWLRFAKRVMTLGSGGRVVFDYDMNIAVPFEAQAEAAAAQLASGEAPAEAPDMWPAWRALGGKPLLLLHGALSDLLSAPVAARMQAEAAGCEVLTLPRIGHAPTLDEPACVAAIDAVLSRAD